VADSGSIAEGLRASLQRPLLDHWDDQGCLARRPRNAEDGQFWVTELGEPLSYWGAQNILRRAHKRSGIDRVHSHLFGHGIAHRAADQGAHPGEIQLLLGHASMAMARRYTGSAAKRLGARLMPQYSPI